MDKAKKRALGVIVFLWIMAYLTAKFADISWLLSCLLLGAVAANSRSSLKAYSSQFSQFEAFFLSIAITLMGFQLNMSALSALTLQTLLLIVAIVLGTIALAFLLGRSLKLSPTMSLFVGVGSAICGSAAIAAASLLFPADEQREEAGISVGAVNCIGLLGLLFLPLLVSYFKFDALAAGVLIGGSLQSIGHVIAAGFAMGPQVGGYAALVKMGRVVFIAPVLLAVGLWTGRSSSRSGWQVLPIYIYGHIAALLLTNLVNLPAGLHYGLKISFDLVLALAMVCIGLKIRLAVLREGVKAVGLAALLFGILLAVLLLSQKLG